MKRRFLLIAALALTILLLAGCGGSETEEIPSEVPVDTEETGVSDEEIYGKYLGDWNGLLKFQGCTGDYANLEGVLTGACARIVIDENGDLLLVYHARPASHANKKCGSFCDEVLYDPCRHARIKEIKFDENNIPLLK